MFETLNGQAVSWAEVSVTINIDGGIPVPQVDIKSVDHESKVDRGEQRGASGGRILKRTTGQLTNSASATFYADGFRNLKAALIPAAVAALAVNSDGHVQLSKVRFDVVIIHDFVGDPQIYCTKLLGCHIDKDSGKNAEGTDAKMVDVDLNPLRIVEVVNGVETVLL